MSIKYIVRLWVLCSAVSGLMAAQVQPRTLISPINNKPFDVNIVPFDMQTFRDESANSPANMGIDSDGCRHHAGFSEYEHYIVSCPFSFFSAVSVEWNERSGRFTQPLSKDFVSWVRSSKGLNTEWVTARNQKFKTEQKLARLRGEDAGPVNEFVMKQNQIGIDRQYEYALRCYAKRGARSAFMAKVALTAAWAVRVHLNRQLSDPDLEGGVREVNARAERHIKENEAFDLKKWHGIYTNIFKGSGLSNEGYFIAGTTLLGLETRMGGFEECDEILEAMGKRFQKVEHGEKLRGITRERRSMLGAYRKFLDAAVVSFAMAIANEEIRRSQLPTTMIAVAEGLRRTNHIDQAIDWYLAIDNMDETEPALRKSIEEMGKAPAPHAPTLVHIGWQAHQRALELIKKMPGREMVISGPDSHLLNAIVELKLGTSEHVNQHWEPTTGAHVKELELMMSELGKALVNYEYKLEYWPDQLGNLWDDGAIPDWNRFNRFRCPVTGSPFRYEKPKISRKAMPKNTVLIACTRPVATANGPRYLNYLVNNSLVWSEQPLQTNTRAP